MDVSAWLEDVAQTMVGQPALVRSVLLGALGGMLPSPMVRLSALGWCN